MSEMHVLFVPDGRQALGLLIDDGNPGRFPDAPDAEKQKALQATVAQQAGLA